MRTCATPLQMILITGLLAAWGLFAAEPPAPGMIGFRGDGSGVFPDSHPPVSCDEKTGQNVLWKAALPNWGYSQPIAVKDKVFVTCEPGWPEDHDFPVLVCYDAVTGTELWRRSLNHLPVVIADEKEREDVARKWHGVLENMRSYHTELNAGRGKEGFDPKALKQRHLAAVFEDVKGLLKHGLILDNWWKSGCGLCCIGSAYPTPCSDGANVYVVTGFHSFFCFDLDGNLKWVKADPYNLWWNTYGGNDYCKNARSPLLYDQPAGARLLISDIAGKVRALDCATGQMVWSRELGKGHQCIVSPVVIATGGKDVLLCGGPGRDLSAFALPEGESIPVYRKKSDLNLDDPLNEMDADLGVPEAKPERWTITGGTMLVKRDERNIVFMTGSGDHVHWGEYKKNTDIHGPACVRFTLGKDVLHAEYVWGGVRGKDVVGNQTVAIVYHGGRLYHQHGFILDAATGTLVAGGQSRGDRAVPATQSLLVAAGDYVYGVAAQSYHWTAGAPKDVHGYLSVYSLDGKQIAASTLCGAPVEGEKQKQTAAMNNFPGWGFSYACPFTVDGDRLYVRSNDFLWCIGRK